jgi:hypothetical protein
MKLNNATKITCESATLTPKELAVVLWHVNRTEHAGIVLGPNSRKMQATLNKLALPSPYGDPR